MDSNASVEPQIQTLCITRVNQGKLDVLKALKEDLELLISLC